MAVGNRLRAALDALRGVTAFAPPTQGLWPELGSPSVDAARRAFGGLLEPIPSVRLRWYPPDIERAQRMAQTGDMLMIGQLCESMKTDGVIRGLGDARTSVINFPKRFFGSPDVVEVLLSQNASDRNVYDEMIPSTEARLMAFDGFVCGVAIGELVPVVGRDFPVLVRRYPQNLVFLPQRNQWYYRSNAGLIPIEPGVPTEDGNAWVLHIPGGRLAPWNGGLWNTLGRSYVNKTQTIFARQSYEMKHAHPARVASAPTGAIEEERQGLIQGLIRWAMNAAFVLPPGYEVRLIESSGRGIEVYEASITTYNQEIATALCGSAVMLQGTVGFSNMDVFRIVQKDLIETTADAWDHTVNTQILPAFIARRWGIDALENATTVKTDASAPADRTAEAAALTGVATAMSALVDAIAKGQLAAQVTEPIALDIRELLQRFGVPVTAVSEIVTPDSSNTALNAEAQPDVDSESARALSTLWTSYRQFRLFKVRALEATQHDDAD